MRWLATAFLALTLLATLGLGEHYLIDLVVAAPFAVAAMSACARQYGRAAWAGALVLAWLIYLRVALPAFSVSAFGAWTAMLATLILSVALATANNLSLRTLFPAPPEVPSPAE